jgi:hypothetical protein
MCNTSTHCLPPIATLLERPPPGLQTVRFSDEERDNLHVGLKDASRTSSSVRGPGLACKTRLQQHCYPPRCRCQEAWPLTWLGTSCCVPPTLPRDT